MQAQLEFRFYLCTRATEVARPILSLYKTVMILRTRTVSLGNGILSYFEASYKCYRLIFTYPYSKTSHD